MITEDYLVSDVWVEFPLRVGGSFVYIADIKDHPIYATIGEEPTTSEGIFLGMEDSIKVQSSIFLRTDRSNRVAKVTVVRD